MTVYLDIVFLENLCMNYIILFATGYIMKLKIKQIRIIFSSMLGSIYAIFIYLQKIFFFSNIMVKIVLSIVMILIAFCPRKKKLLFRELILFYLVSFVFGGCAFFLLYFVKPQNVLIRNGVYVGRYPIKIAILGGSVGFIIIQMAFKFAKVKITKKDILADLIICWNKKQVKLKALVDTGNMLKDPITGSPVIVVDRDELYHIFPKEILDNLQDIINGKLPKEIFLKEQEFISKFRMIPFSSLGKQNGLLLGIKVDEVKISFNDIDGVVNGAIIGIYDKPMSKKNEYTALVGLDVLEGSEKSELASNVKVTN